METQAEKENHNTDFIVDREELLELKEFQFGSETGKSTRLQLIGYTKNSIVVTFFNRSGKADASWQYYDIEQQLAEKLYKTITDPYVVSIGKKFNELFFSNKLPVFTGRKIAFTGTRAGTGTETGTKADKG